MFSRVKRSSLPPQGSGFGSKCFTTVVTGKADCQAEDDQIFQEVFLRRSETREISGTNLTEPFTAVIYKVL